MPRSTDQVLSEMAAALGIPALVVPKPITAKVMRLVRSRPEYELDFTENGVAVEVYFEKLEGESADYTVTELRLNGKIIPDGKDQYYWEDYFDVQQRIAEDMIGRGMDDPDDRGDDR